MANEHDEALLDAMAALHMSEQYSDMVISCGGREFRVHQAVVCSQSDLLAREIKSNFKESAGVIEHNHFGPEAIQRMIQYLYTRSYDVPSVKKLVESTGSASPGTQEPVEDTGDGWGGVPNSPSAAPQSLQDQQDEGSGSLSLNEVLTLHVEMSAVGSYFHIDSLRLKAAQVFKSTIEAYPWEMEGFPALIDKVYAEPKSEDQGMRDAVLEAAQEHALALSQEADFVAMIDKSAYLGEFCAAFAHAVMQGRMLDAGRYEVEQMALNEQLLDLQSAFDQQDQAMQAVKLDLDRVTRILQDLEFCRHAACGNRIAVTVETSRGATFVRCKSCRTKHF